MLEGLKPRKIKIDVKIQDNKKSIKQPKQPKAKKIVKKSFLADDAGDLPVLKRKKAVAPKEIESSDIDEVE